MKFIQSDGISGISVVFPEASQADFNLVKAAVRSSWSLTLPSASSWATGIPRPKYVQANLKFSFVA